MNLFLNAGSVYFLFKILDKKQDWKLFFKQGDIYFYVLFRTLALYTHYFSFFIFTVEIILILFVSRLRVVARIKLVLVSLAAIFLLYLPWLQMFYGHITRGQSWRYGQLTNTVSTELLNFLKDINLGLYYHYTDLDFIKYITIFLVLVYASSFILSFLPVFRRSLSPNASIGEQESVTSYNSIIPFLLVVIPIILGIIISLKQKVEFYRYLSIIIPYIIILFVFGITNIKKRIIYVPVILLLIMINIFGLTVYYSNDFKNDDYRPLIQHIENNFTAGERIYFEPHYMGWSIDYYKKQNDLKLPNPVFIRYGWNEILDSINVQKPERFWVVFDYSSVDTTKYAGYIIGLINDFKLEGKIIFSLKPTKVELYKFRKNN